VCNLKLVICLSKIINEKNQFYKYEPLYGSYGPPIPQDEQYRYVSYISDRGEIDVNYRLGMLLLDKSEIDNGINSLISAANNHSLIALMKLGNIYEEGTLVSIDLVKAEQFYRKGLDISTPIKQEDLTTEIYSRLMEFHERQKHILDELDQHKKQPNNRGKRGKRGNR
jgi:hypothetical protein